jgi:hypothetical protein
VGHGLGRLGGDAGFEPFQIVGQRVVLLAGVNPADGLQFDPEPAAGKMNAEDMENRRSSKDGQIRPDGQESSILSQKPPGPAIGSVPGNVAAKVERQAAAEGCPGADQKLDRLCPWQAAPQEELGLGMRASSTVEGTREHS